MRTSASLLAATLMVSFTSAGLAENWPQWRGPRGDGISTETGLAEKWPEGGPKKVWTAEVGVGYSSPIGYEDKVYIFAQQGDQDTLTALDAATGKVAWSKGYLSKAKHEYPGTRATPTIEGKFIYTYGGGSDLVCRKLADGQVVWQFNVLAETKGKNLRWGQASSPFIVGELLYVQAGEQGPAVVAVNKATGKIAWQSQPSGVMASYATPILAEVEGVKQLIVFAGKSILALDPATGKTLWSRPHETDWDINAASPIYAGGRLFITSDYGTGCEMLKPGKAGVEVLWQNKEIKSKTTAPILEKEYLYGASEGTLKCLHWPDGKVLWTCQNKRLNIGNDGGSILRVGDKLILMSETGKLSLAKATPAGIMLISQIPLFSGNDNWSSPLLYKGRLYAKGPKELVCLDVAEARTK